jgi:ATP synthase protein I
VPGSRPSLDAGLSGKQRPDDPDLWGWEARDAERAYRHVADGQATDDAPVEPLRLTEAERGVLRQQAVRDLLYAIIIQVVVSLIIIMLAWAVSGRSAAGSAGIGAAAYVIPNALFAFRLILSVQKPGGANPATFLIGELLKIACAAVLIVVAAKVCREWLVWPAFLAGLIGALKSQWFAVAFSKKN